MNYKLQVELESELEGSFTGHAVNASFEQSVSVDSNGEPLSVSREVTAPVDADGKAVLEFPPDISKDKDIRARVLAPDGEVLTEVEVSVDLVGGEEPLVIEVDPKEYFPIEHTTDPAFGKPARLRGLVVDPSGKGRVGNRQVVIWAEPAEPSGAPMEIVVVARTDGRGYFSATYPVRAFAEAQGSVDGGTLAPISLADDGGLPERLVLGVELPGDAEEDRSKDDCACTSGVPRDPDAGDLVNAPETFSSDVGGGYCVDITKPNRVLEEFDYSAVVRTTEPEIRGLTITEPPKIRLKDIIGILDPKIFSFMLRTQPADLLFATPETAGVEPESLRSAFRARSPLRTERRYIDPSDAEALASHALFTTRPELEHLSEVIGLASLRLAGSRPGAGEPQPEPQPEPGGNGVDLDSVRIETELVKTLARDPDGFSLTRLAQAEIATRKNDLIRLLDLIRRRLGGRTPLSCPNPVDWDDEPTFYQACTIAHGHILHFKQQWVADGYSMGDLLYSLPLAPCQKKQIVVIDWDRRESAARLESLEEREVLTAHLSRDRDISEIANASVRESMSGGSEAETSAFGGGLGIGAIIGPVGGLLGIGGGTSGASSSAWQNSSRTTSANSLQQLRDRTVQGASAVRSQRSTVIQTVRQGEMMRVETDAVANHNHCHAITIEYFEVLRHFLVRHHLADVQECLLVPLLMTRFYSAKARRWREVLSQFLQDRRLIRGFDALQRIADNYVGSDMPTGSYAEEELVYLDGYFRIQFRIQRPRDNNDGTFLPDSWSPLSWLGITAQEWWKSYLENQQERDRIFAEVLGPRISEEITNGLRFYVVDENDNQTQLPIDPTLVSDFRNDVPLYASLRLSGDLPPIRRDRIKFVKIDTTIDTKAGPRNIDDILPAGSKTIIESGQMGYRTAHIAHDLFRQSRILNDLSGTDGVFIYTPLSRRELRRPREEDKEFASALLKHLNDHLEHYHRAIWWRMDPQRRFMLLDGFIAPNSGGRSVASVVENRLVGIIGNCLVMPVSPGFHLDPTFQQDEDNPIDLLEHYQPTTPVAPLRLAVPTKGVFAESVMGACNSCEKKDEARFWRWEESPCPDEPTAIQPVSTESRRAEPPSLTPQPFPQPIVAFQNVPTAPDPQGFGGLLQLLSSPNLFRDITGLTENQRNALAALQSALGTAQFFGGKAADLALQGNMRQDIDKALNKINEQHQAGSITDQQRSQLTEAALRSMIGGGTETPAKPMTTEEVKSLTRTAGAEDAAVSVSRPGGESVFVNAQATTASLKQPLQERCGFFGPNDTVVTEADLRDGIRFAAEVERRNWLDPAGNLLEEDEDSQFGLLVSYWLSRSSAIRPTTLSMMQSNAISALTNYGQLLNDAASNATVNAEIARVRGELLVAAPDTGSPANLNTLIGQALRNARFSRQDQLPDGPWSAVFVVACVRGTAILLGLEGMTGGTHVGRDELLLADQRHAGYVLEAYRRRFGPNRRDGTYLAFQVDQRDPQVGDIIIQDRRPGTGPNAIGINDVLDFDDIPTSLTGGFLLHADIIVEVAADQVVAIGGNLDHSVRRRAYPLGADGRLVVALNELFTQEDDNGTLPALPVANPGATLHGESTGRIFALLSLEQLCAVIPGQQVNGGVIV